MGVMGQIVEHDGESLSVHQWEKKLGWGYGTLRHRLQSGMSAEDALRKPVKSGGTVSCALLLTGGKDWAVALAAAIVLQAMRDLKDPWYQYDVESFFDGGLFEALFDMDGEIVLAEIKKRQKECGERTDLNNAGICEL